MSLKELGIVLGWCQSNLTHVVVNHVLEMRLSWKKDGL